MVLDDSTLMSLARRDDVGVHFPELMRLRGAQHACCGRPGVTKDMLQDARGLMAGLSSERQQKLKELLGVKEVTVRYRAGQELREAKY